MKCWKLAGYAFVLSTFLALIYCIYLHLRSDSHCEICHNNRSISHKQSFYGGKLYGQVFEAQIKVVKNDNYKDRYEVLQLIAIDKLPVKSSIVIPYECLSEEKLVEGKHYSCLAYFSGSYVGKPEEVLLDQPAADYSFHFWNFICIYDLKGEF
jgi:hypothetical protein